MTELSRAAQAVMDAFEAASDGHYSGGEWIQNYAGQIAAALRAVADRIMDLIPDVDTSGLAPGAEAAEVFVEAIAAELEDAAMPIPAPQPTQLVVSLEQPPEPTPGEPSETFYDWIVSNSKGEQEASGGAPTYALAWSEGHRYLAQYSQDGPHLLEISRVQVVYSLEAGQEGEQ